MFNLQENNIHISNIYILAESSAQQNSIWSKDLFTSDAVSALFKGNALAAEQQWGPTAQAASVKFRQ